LTFKNGLKKHWAQGKQRDNQYC